MNHLENIRESYNKGEISLDQRIKYELLVASNLKATEKAYKAKVFNTTNLLSERSDWEMFALKSAAAFMGGLYLVVASILIN